MKREKRGKEGRGEGEARERRRGRNAVTFMVFLDVKLQQIVSLL